MNRPTLYLLFLLIITACNNQPDPIEYGTTSCHGCKMTIVDQQHAAQVMTKKGRTYSFDAIECMIRGLKQWSQDELKTILVTDYNSPKQLIDAQAAHYLISKNIPSPMGAHLSAFAQIESREALSESAVDLKLTWSEVKSTLD